jgi:hypothetical protein
LLENGRTAKGNDGVSFEQPSNNRRTGVDESSGNRQEKQQSGRETLGGAKLKYALDENGMWELEHIFEDDDPKAEADMMRNWKED